MASPRSGRTQARMTITGFMILFWSSIFTTAAAASATASSAAVANDVVFELPHLVKVYRSGRVVRLACTDTVPPSVDLSTGVVSKDVIIDFSTAISARLFLPYNASAAATGFAAFDRKLPVLIYLHGGAFCCCSAASPIYHRHLNDLTSLTPLLGVSVNYRLIPEHRLPAAYDDAWAALRWVFSRADPWLAQHGDFRRVFIAGDSAGGNIAYQAALRASAEGNMAIKGMALVHPYFCGSAPVGSEPRDPVERARMDKEWEFVFPGTAGPDDPRRNPVAAGAVSLAALRCERVLVAVAGKDVLRDRGIQYYEKLRESGWPGVAVLVDTPKAKHDFHIDHAGTKKAKAMTKLLAGFFRKE